ncbi:hypothetical protein BBP40_002923 [Aspergillus hancockii]|nr:hypothetical protein BBP40_002923 [Aspergillus hancockii]
MGDRFSVTTGAFGIISLGITVCGGITKYCSSVKRASEEVSRIAHEAKRMQKAHAFVEKDAARSSAPVGIDERQDVVTRCWGDPLAVHSPRFTTRVVSVLTKVISIGKQCAGQSAAGAKYCFAYVSVTLGYIALDRIVLFNVTVGAQTQNTQRLDRCYPTAKHRHAYEDGKRLCEFGVEIGQATLMSDTTTMSLSSLIRKHRFDLSFAPVVIVKLHPELTSSKDTSPSSAHFAVISIAKGTN